MPMRTEAVPVRAKRVEPVLEAINDARFELAGELRRRLNAITRQWLLSAPFANPAMLEMFRNRDRLPYQKQTPWAGEYAGKYLTGAVQVLHLSQNSQLEAHLRWFVQQLIALQDTDGYLGAWPRPWRMRKNAPNCPLPWDAWSHYHLLVGLLLWYRYTITHTAPPVADRKTFQKSIAAIDLAAGLPVDYILTSGAPKALVKAARREAIPIISLRPIP